MKANTLEDTETYTKEYLVDEYEKINVKYRRMKVLEILNQHKPRRILEIGCGAQSLFEFYSDFDSFTIVEPSAEFCSIAEKSARLTNRVHILNGFFGTNEMNRKLADVGGGYDCIVISSLIHEVPDYEPILRSARDLCDEATFVHVNVPNEDSFHLLWALEAGLIERLDTLSETAKRLQRSRTFNLEKLRKAVEANGFEITEQGSYAFKLFNNANMLRLLHDGIIDENLLDALNRLPRLFTQNGAEIFVNCRKA